MNSYIPGHIHAFYLEYVYYDRREQAREGRFTAARAPGVFSERVQSGGHGYGTIVQPVRWNTNNHESLCLGYSDGALVDWYGITMG
jgi:hypothetical protein